jgi:hypothetical protein
MVIAVIRLVSLQLCRIEIYHYNSPISNFHGLRYTTIILILPKLCHILHLCALEPISRMYVRTKLPCSQLNLQVDPTLPHVNGRHGARAEQDTCIIFIESCWHDLMASVVLGLQPRSIASARARPVYLVANPRYIRITLHLSHLSFLVSSFSHFPAATTSRNHTAHIATSSLASSPLFPHPLICDL